MHHVIDHCFERHTAVEGSDFYCAINICNSLSQNGLFVFEE
jgi:hypothetical protein